MNGWKEPSPLSTRTLGYNGVTNPNTQDWILCQKFRNYLVSFSENFWFCQYIYESSNAVQKLIIAVILNNIKSLLTRIFYCVIPLYHCSPPEQCTTANTDNGEITEMLFHQRTAIIYYGHHLLRTGSALRVTNSDLLWILTYAISRRRSNNAR